MISPGLNLVMTVIGFAVSTMFIVFMCTRLICGRIHLRNSRMSLPADTARSDLGIVGSFTLEQVIDGLEPVTVASFPTKKFGAHPFSSGQDTQAGDAEAYLLSMPDHEATMEEVRHEAGDEHVQEDVRDLQKGILWHSTFNKGVLPACKIVFSIRNFCFRSMPVPVLKAPVFLLELEKPREELYLIS